MTVYISATLRRQVIERAENRCEYCLLPQPFSMYSHEIDHVVATKHRGTTTLDNLVLACLPCNRHKGSDLTSIDDKTGKVTLLFNPRKQEWHKHFALNDGHIVGKTAVGRTTALLLQFNNLERLRLRRSLIARSLYP
ncbi:MAG: HNH endonuclease signature motif containing protein [Cyanobacteria bacterium P01_F01_bin.150]